MPLFRTQLSDTFVMTWVDFAGPVYYKITKSSTAKAYIALFTCASIRAVHLKLRVRVRVRESLLSRHIQYTCLFFFKLGSYL